MRFDGKPPRIPSALEKVLERLSILHAHELGCSCPACTREGDARKLEPRWTLLQTMEVTP